MMKRPCVFLPLLLCAAANAGAALVALEEPELADVRAGEGLKMLLEYRINSDERGDPLSSLSSCSGIGNPCVFSIKLNNRNSGSGEWLVFKDFYGRMTFNGLTLDYLPNPSTASAYDNPLRFQDENGVCLLASCEASSVPAMGLSFSGDVATLESDLELKLDIGRVAIEYGTTGYGADINGSFLGIRVRDDAVTGNAAAIDIDGSVRLFGF